MSGMKARYNIKYIVSMSFKRWPASINCTSMIQHVPNRPPGSPHDKNMTSRAKSCWIFVRNCDPKVCTLLSVQDRKRMIFTGTFARSNQRTVQLESLSLLTWLFWKPMTWESTGLLSWHLCCSKSTVLLVILSDAECDVVFSCFFSLSE